MFLFTVIRRTFSSNLQAVAVSEFEQAGLQAGGIDQGTIQKYFAWRRSLVIFVVLSTVLSAALSTYREATETEAKPDVFEMITHQVSQKQQEAITDAIKSAGGEVPESVKEAAVEAASEVQKAQDKADEDKDDTNNEADEPAGDEKADAQKTVGLEESDQAADEEPEEPQTTFAHFADFVHLIALYALPAAALAVAILWTKFKTTFRIMVAGFAFSFLVPLLIALCPWSWWGYVEPVASAQQKPMQNLERLTDGLMEGLAYLVTLLPTVISLVPGVQKACLRVKSLLPQSMLPGWFLVAASPFYALFLLVVFVAINQVASDPLFFCGMLLFLSAPLVYAIRADVYTSPLVTEDDMRRIRGVQRVIGLMTVSAAGLLVAYVTTQDLMGIRLFGTNPKTALMQPIDLVEFFLETIGRSMFMTVLGADVFMRMNLAAWQNNRDFQGTEAAADYDKIMSEMERVSK